jgi:hypothetical protein
MCSTVRICQIDQILAITFKIPLTSARAKEALLMAIGKPATELWMHGSWRPGVPIALPRFGNVMGVVFGSPESSETG